MADKRIDELEEATSITGTDLFVLEQANTAKKLTGQTMTNFLLALANGHGGISTIAKTSSTGTNPVVDTYTITFADNTTTTFQVTNGVKGDQGPRGYTGNPGADITITSTSVQYQEWTSGTSYPTGTWLDNPPSVAQGNFLWTRTIVNYSDGGQTVSYSVARNGVDGSGAVSTVCGVSPDGSGNVALTAIDVGALPGSYQPPVTSVNTKTGAVVLDNEDVQAKFGLSVYGTPSAAGWYRVLLFDPQTASDRNGIGAVIDFEITRRIGETHKISLLLDNGRIAFADETSNSDTLYIDKIRYNVSSTQGFVDIHFTDTNARNVGVSASITVPLAEHLTEFSTQAFTAVNDAPTGETVSLTYTFTANRVRGRHLIYTGTAQSGTVPMTDNIYNYDLLVLTCMTNVDTYVYTLSPNQFIGNNWICSASAGPIEGGYTYNSSLGVAPANSGGSLALSVSSNNANWSLHLHRVEGIIL